MALARVARPRDRARVARRHRHPRLRAPPPVNGRLLKLKHVHFAGINPTTLVIHSNQDKKIPSNYKKYLENSFRSALELKSIQLRLIFRKSENPYESKVNKLTDRQVKKRQRLIKHIKKNKK